MKYQFRNHLQSSGSGQDLWGGGGSRVNKKRTKMVPCSTSSGNQRKELRAGSREAGGAPNLPDAKGGTT